MRGSSPNKCPEPGGRAFIFSGVCYIGAVPVFQHMGRIKTLGSTRPISEVINL